MYIYPTMKSLASKIQRIHNTLVYKWYEVNVKIVTTNY